MINKNIIGKVLSFLLMGEAVFMLLTLLVSLIYKENDITAFAYSFAITFGIGFLTFLLTRKGPVTISKREGYIIVTFGWIIFSFFGSLPFILSNAIPSFTDSFFETMSGFTTTGSSILNNIEELPHGILFWRSLIQWLGGMGFIVLSLAILPILGIGGMQLFVAEVPGPTPDKLHPRIKETAQKLWGIYILFTALETVLLYFGGMSVFDAICHSFTTMATGGYSTKQDSIGHWNSPYIQWVIIIFMFIAGTNFTLSYFGLHGKIRKVWENEEFRFYFFFTAGFSLIITLSLILFHDLPWFTAVTDAVFQVVSVITTTGFATADYELWTPFLSTLILVLMFFGGSAGSTGGGVKIVRIVLLIKNGYFELKRLIHPQAIIPVRFNKRAVDQGIVHNVIAFIIFYVFIFAVGVVIMTFLEPNLDTAIGAVATTLGNIGPGIGSVGPTENFAHFSDVSKWFLSFLMLLGRLELFTVLLLFTRAFWKK